MTTGGAGEVVAAPAARAPGAWPQLDAIAEALVLGDSAEALSARWIAFARAAPAAADIAARARVLPPAQQAPLVDEARRRIDRRRPTMAVAAALAGFLARRQALGDELAALIGAGTCVDDLRRLLHTVKGEAGMLGLEPLAACCAHAEMLVAANDHAGLLVAADWAGGAVRVLSAGSTPPDFRPGAPAPSAPAAVVPGSANAEELAALAALAQRLAAAPDAALATRLAERLRALAERAAMGAPSPLAPLLDRLGRLARSLADERGIDLRCLVCCGEATVPATAVGPLSDALVHLIRNAVAHGAEPAAVRVAAGKPPALRLTLSAEVVAGVVTLQVIDDGPGLDAARLAAAAGRAGDLLDLAATAGVSTAATVSDLAGRGIGLDAVRRAIAAVGGRLTLDNRPGAGATFLITLGHTAHGDADFSI